MIELNNNRLIGDFFETNAAIGYEESSNEKSPKFLVKWRAKRQRKKLISIINNLCDSEYVLTRDNIYELFVYLFNNADIYNKDNIKIFKPESSDADDRIEGVIKLDNLMTLIHLEHNTSFMEITIEAKSENNSSKIEINRSELADNMGIAEESLKKINKYLLSIIKDFLLFNITKYTAEGE